MKITESQIRRRVHQILAEMAAPENVNEEKERHILKSMIPFMSRVIMAVMDDRESLGGYHDGEFQMQAGPPIIDAFVKPLSRILMMHPSMSELALSFEDLEGIVREALYGVYWTLEVAKDYLEFEPTRDSIIDVVADRFYFINHTLDNQALGGIGQDTIYTKTAIELFRELGARSV